MDTPGGIIYGTIRNIPEEIHRVYPVTCKTCSKTTWGGCGQHVDSVMRTVPASERCTCEKPAKSGFFASLFGR
ncbi:hypothetical protein GS934_09725 [Rhodococcus hoagii]|nr:hypothetical protein [Prescottella equi]NKZ87620.1 hypothetical protein [Prescottella equi]